MTIDEAIEKYKLMATKGNIMFPQRPDVAEKSNRDYKQTAEWLEELKCYRNENNFSEYADRLYKKAYNKALDDIKTKIDDEYCDGGYGDYHEVEMIVRMIEQLSKE